MATDIEGQNISGPSWIKRIKSTWAHLGQTVWWLYAGAADEARTINGLPLGYPRFCGLIGVHPAFSLCRRFPDVRARLLLVKQNHVSELEEELRKLDFDEQRPLYLGSLRRDRNARRKEVLEALDEALKEYDELTERNVRMFQLPTASDRNIASLKNWVEGTGAICRKEARFLYQEDLCAAGGSSHHGLELMESFIERFLIKLHQQFGQKPSISENNRIYIFRGPAFWTITHASIAALVVLLLLVPVVAMRCFESATYQVFCIAIASILFTVILSGPMNARPAEVFVAGATYAALLVVFLSSKNGDP